MSKPLTRRDFLREGGLCATAATLASSPLAAAAVAKGAPRGPGIRWAKAPCRFCGVGCGVMVGTRQGRVVAVKGDDQHPGTKGLLCAKGYSLPAILTGGDRLTTPLIRKGGKLVKATWDEALDLVARRFKETLAAKGPEAVAIYGSGQWMITDGYAATKWFRAGMGSNNVEANARLCMASAVTGFMSTFGSDEPMGCFEDLALCDVLILWGNNMAEAHPVLFGQVLESKGANPAKRIVDLATRRTPTSDFADTHLLMAPQSDLAIANGIAHLLVKKGAVDKDFIARHVVFKRGKEQIGYGLADKSKFADEPKKATFEEYAAFLETYTPEHVAKVSGLSVAALEQLAGYFADPKLKVMSVWCMGVNQHSRGTWMNNLIYNLHLLTGKICKPGSTAYSITGQPSACGTVREVGDLAHRLPADMVVMNPEHRAIAARIWKVPVERINPKPGHHTVEMFRALDRGDITCMWIQVTNPFVSLPNVERYRKGARKDGRFIVVSDVYPTVTTDFADVVLPSAMWVEREGLFGNSDRRTQHWDQLAEPPKGCLPDDWQIIEVARRMGLGDLFPKDRATYVKELFEEYRQFTVGTGKDLGTFEELKAARGLRWPVVKGRETARRYVEGEDPFVKAGEGVSFYKNKADGGRAVVWLRPWEGPAEVPDAEYPLWFCTGRMLEHWHTGTMTRRVPQLNRAQPGGFLEIHPEDAKALGVADGGQVKVTSRRGSVTLPCRFAARGKVPRGTVYTSFFDESQLINAVTQDSICPISAEPDYKKCACRVEKA
ncbi:molybdopterin-dependent oxidoreductase [Mesoterricola silvestris]|uniref:Nitrate reductase n=1 Tax=Mesoterricola silvestris TaxID=2927979 RepID=A0AA48GUZ1_9BACT|nr:molybdopterin-dependent oxidoreductase [Mesoterricola silvestris]BDU72301.1 nitrate reductase catalytic subunit [Mesoterricola silvestris]